MSYERDISSYLEKDDNKFVSCEGVSMAHKIGKGVAVSGNRGCKKLDLGKGK